MKSPVYRNLDKPFQIVGFNALELTALCILLVGGGELAQAMGSDRGWALGVTVLSALTMYWTRRSLGDLFVRRLLRFSNLPSELWPRLFK